MKTTKTSYKASEGWIKAVITPAKGTLLSEREVKDFISGGKPQEYEWSPPRLGVRTITIHSRHYTQVPMPKDKLEEGDVVMYAVTHINKDGMRTLSFGNQGRNHYSTGEGAASRLQTLMIANSSERVASTWGAQAVGTFAVRPVVCYHHGDAKGIYFDL